MFITFDKLLYTNIDQKLVNSLHGLLNCEIDGLDCHVITTEYRTNVTPILQCTGPCNLFRSFRSMFGLYTNIDQPLLNSLHGLLNYCEIGGLDCRVITTEYRTCEIILYIHY